MIWINFLHFYQSPVTSDEVIHEVVKSSYQPWVKFLNKYKKVKVTVNFSACLTERLFNLGYGKLLKDYARLAKRGQIEFVSSAAFHSILPLLPKKETIKQIQINDQINKNRFGAAYKPTGFFLPELAYSKNVAKIIKKLKYKYIILDEISYAGKLNSQIDNNLKYKIKNIGINIIFRNRIISRSFVPETIINIIEGRDKRFNIDNKNRFIITATDAELYGHRYWNWHPAFSFLVDKLKIKTLTISEYLKSLKKERTVEPIASNWESIEEELKRGLPYGLWYDPKNKIQKLLWQLANFALELNYKSEKDENHFASRLHLEKGLASCTFWWASNRDFRLFGPPAWHPEEIEKGAAELLASVRSLTNITPNQKLKAEKLFSQIRDLVWNTHWNNK